MTEENIDYESLKRRGFLKQRQDGFFILRTRMNLGTYTKNDLSKLGEIAEKYGRGFVHTTTRQGIEIPFIKFEDIENAERELVERGILMGTSGLRIRTITSCPGNNWCRFGLINTFSLYGRIENELGLKRGVDLPHKFKIAISGCPNMCTRANASDIGIHGEPKGYTVYLGGCAGRTSITGFKLDKIFTEEEILSIVKKTVTFFKNNAKPRQRLAFLIEEIGKENFLKKILG